MAIIPTDLQSTVAAFSADLQQKITEWLQWDKVRTDLVRFLFGNHLIF